MSEKKKSDKIPSIDEYLKFIEDAKKSPKQQKQFNELSFLFEKPLPVKTHSSIKNNISMPNYLYQADTLYLPTQAFGYKYCLVVVDVANSKCDAVPLKAKDENAILNGFKKLFKQDILKYPIIMQMDSGSEFKNAVIKNYFKDLQISIKYTLTNRHKQNSMAENRNKQIANLILTYQSLLEAQTKKVKKNWVEYLPKVIEHLNKTLPKPIKRNYLHGDINCKNNECELLNIGDKVYHILDYPKDGLGKKQKGVFRVGDRRWDDKPLTIGNIILSTYNPPLYVLNKPDSDKLNTTVAYGKNELKPV
jgi:hypothetical protein